jgi:PAS domain S-box-containing protein
LFRQRADLTFSFASPRIQEMTGMGMDELQESGERFWQFVHEADADELRKQIQRCIQVPDGITNSFRIRNVQTGRVTYLAEFRRAIADDDGRLGGYEGFWQDITRQTISERRLSTAAWKETLAVLTMGLAHDFNNVMAGILSLSESFLLQIEKAHPFHEGLSLIRHNAKQAAQLVHRIVNLHHGKIGNRGYHNLNDIVSDTADLLRKVVPRRITVSAQLAGAQLPIYVDAVELRQLVINLALNGVDAMPRHGNLSLETTQHHQMPELRQFHGRLPRLPAVCLSVADTGCGIKSHHLQSIFDPFFTTKAHNKGCGLGLYNARVFVEKHHGAISVDSVEGQGATFSLWLPQSDLTEAEQAAPIRRPRRNLLLCGSKGSATLESVAEFWRQHGYQIVTAGPDMAERLQEGEYHFDGCLVLAEPDEFGWKSLVDLILREKFPWKMILQIIGCNRDELETRHLLKADLVISEEMSEEAVLEKMAALFEAARKGPV